MNYAALKSELAADPLGLGYASMTDEEAAAALNAPTRTVTKDVLNANAKTVLHLLGAAAGAAFLDALSSVATSNSAVKWALDFLRSEGGLNLADPETLGMLDQLAAAGAVDPASVATLKAAAQDTVSRAEELGLGVVRPGDVEYARAI